MIYQTRRIYRQVDQSIDYLATVERAEYDRRLKSVRKQLKQQKHPFLKKKKRDYCC